MDSGQKYFETGLCHFLDSGRMSSLSMKYSVLWPDTLKKWASAMSWTLVG